MSDRDDVECDRVGIELRDDAQAIALATKIADCLQKTVVVTDADGRQVCIMARPRKLDS
jgi:hypothetical protein